jgi:hypothetical protein
MLSESNYMVTAKSRHRMAARTPRSESGMMQRLVCARMLRAAATGALRRSAFVAEALHGCYGLFLREPADSLSDKSNVDVGWLPSLTFRALDR